MSEPIHILYVDDDRLNRELVRDALEQEGEGFQVTEAASRQEFEAHLAEATYDLVLSEFNILGFDGLAVIEAVRAKDPGLPVVIVTGTGSEEVAVEALKRGAADYVIKTPAGIRRLPHTIRAVMRNKYLEEERQRAGEALRESQANLSALIENTDASLWSVDGEYRLIVGNSVFHRNIRAARGRPFAPGDNVLPEDLEVALDDWRRYYDRALRGERFIVESQRRFVDTLRHMEYRFNPIHAADGSVAGVTVLGRDITEQKRAEQALRKSEEGLARAQRIGHLGNWDWDVKNQTLTWSDEAYRIFGLDKDFGLTYEGIEAMIHPDDRAQNQAKVNEILTTADAVEFEFRIIRPDGAIRHIYQGVEVSRDGAGDASRVFGIMHDITERKQAEAALRESAGQWQTTFDAIGTSVCLLDLEGKVLRCNAATTNLLGRPSDQIVGHSCWELMCGTSEAVEDCPVARMRQTRRREIQTLDMDGRIFEVSVDPVFDEGGQLIGGVHIMADVTERTRAEIALMESEARLAEAQRIARIGNWEWEVATGRVVWSDEVYRIFDVPPQEASFELVQSLVHPDDLEFWQNSVRAAVEEDAPFQINYRALRPDGEIVWIYNEAEVLRDDEGKALLVFGIAQDVTARVQAESQREAALQALRESEEKYRLVSENIPVVVYSALPDERSTSIFISGRAEELTGYEAEELLADTDLWSSIVHPQDREYVWDRIAEHRRKKGPLDVEYRILTKAGGIRWIRDKATPALDETGHIIRIDGFMEDVTDRVRSEEALRESEARFRVMFESAHDLLAVTDEEGRAIWANPAWQKTLGYTQQEQGFLFEKTHPDDQKRVMKAWRALEGGEAEIKDLEYRYRTAAGDYVVLETTVTRLTVTGKTFLYVVAHDITGRKRAETALQHSLEETARGHRTLLALSQAAQAVQRARTSQEVYRTVGDQISKLGYQIVVFTLTEKGTHLEVAHMTYDSDLVQAGEALTGRPTQGYRFPLAQDGLLQRIIDTKETVLTERVAEHTAEALPRPMRSLAGRLMSLLELEQGILAPMVIDGETHGLLVVTGQGLTRAEVPAVTTIANQMAIAIENARLLEQVSDSRERLRLLAQQVVSAQEEERHRLSRELHDEAGQALTALKITLDLIASDLPGEAHALRQRMSQAAALTESTMERIRTLAHDLRPPALDTVGLFHTLEGLCRDFAGRTGLAVDYGGADDLPALPEAADICLYRFLQEALTNVAKHAQAEQVWVRLGCDAQTASLSVEDNGRGFDEQEALGAAGIGLLGAQERLELLGGYLEIETHPDQGTRLMARVPLKKPCT